jgi:hypothetical protein
MCSVYSGDECEEWIQKNKIPGISYIQMHHYLRALPLPVQCSSWVCVLGSKADGHTIESQSGQIGLFLLAFVMWQNITVTIFRIYNHYYYYYYYYYIIIIICYGKTYYPQFHVKFVRKVSHHLHLCTVHLHKQYRMRCLYVCLWSVSI